MAISFFGQLISYEWYKEIITAPPNTASEFKSINKTSVSGRASLANWITFFNVRMPRMIPVIPEK